MTKRNNGFAKGAKPGRSKGLGSFSMLVHAYFQSAQYVALTDPAARLLVDMLCMYRGNNNGDLSITWKLMLPLGWTSKRKLARAEQELLDRGWVIRTRQGGRNATTLHALTFFGIDPCEGKLDAGIKAEPTPLHLWKNPAFAPRKQSARGFGRAKVTGRLSESEQTSDVAGSNVVPLRSAS